MTAPVLSGASRITLHDLRTRVEMRDGADELVVGRVDTGEFIAVPPVAGEVLRLLGGDLTIDRTRERVRETLRRDIDVARFVDNLVALGFVAAVDGTPVPGPPPPRASLPWLRPAHVRWLLTWQVLVALVLAVMAAVVAVAVLPGLLPNYHDLLWTSRASLVLAGNAIIAWSIVALHELAHLTTARAAGVPGRMSFGTRLQFLVAQTSVSGIWASPRWQRMTVYLSGIGVNIGVASVAVLTRTVVREGTLVDRLATDAAMLSLVMVTPQLLFFMRTDLYFVLQDLTGCRNLYADGSAYVRWWARHQWRRVTGSAVDAGSDPSGDLAANERRAVRTYAWVLLLGTAVCVTVAVMVSVPFALTVLSTAVAGVVAGEPAQRIDGLLTVMIVGGYWALWCRMWWRRHGHRVRPWLGRASGCQRLR